MRVTGRGHPTRALIGSVLATTECSSLRVTGMDLVADLNTIIAGTMIAIVTATAITMTIMTIITTTVIKSLLPSEN